MLRLSKKPGAFIIAVVAAAVALVLPARVEAGVVTRVADLVLGQTNFNSNVIGGGAYGVNVPGGIATDPASGRVYVSDTGNSRVLWWNNAASLLNGQNADGVLGQADFSNISGSCTQTRMGQPYGIAVDASGNVWVADSGNNRILKYAAPVSIGQAASLVLGQGSFSTNLAASTATALNFPKDVEVDSAGNVWVADYNNNRVLKYTAPSTNGQAASLVLGQGNFTSATQACSQTGMRNPNGLAVDSAGNVWVSDAYNNRVLKYTTPSTNGQAASLVLGQSNFSSYSTSCSPVGLYFPCRLDVDSAGNVWVADNSNNRVLKYSTPTINGQAASLVLGQADFNSGGYACSPTRMCYPGGLEVDAIGNIWVTDAGNTRVLKFNALMLKAITPASGGNFGSVSISALTGQEFPGPLPIKLSRSGQPDIMASNVTVLSPTRIACTFNLTNKATGTWDVTISTGGPGALSATLPGGFNILPLQLNSITTNFGINTGSVNVSCLSGQGFIAGLPMTVKLSRSGQPDITASNVTVVSSTQIACTFDLTGKTPGYWDVTVSTGGTGALSATIPGGFIVVSQPLSVNAITPNVAIATGTLTISNLSGQGFLPGATVKLSKSGQPDITASSVTVVSQDRISCTFDLAGKAAGCWDVTVSTGGACSLAATLSGGLTVTALPLCLTAITPNVAVATGTVNITGLSGQGFLPGMTVKLSKSGQPDIAASGVTVISQNQISCTFDLTDKATGYWDVTVSTAGTGWSASAVLPGGLALVSRPFAVCAITPSIAANTGSLLVADISGLGFLSGVTVRLTRSGQPDITASSVTVVSPTHITCAFDLTGKATGYWDVLVSPGGTGSLSALLPNGLTIVPAIGLVSITPNNAMNSGPVHVTELSGQGFLPGTTVKLSKSGQQDIIASSVTVVSPGRITCVFDLTGKALGYWDVTASTGGTGSLSATIPGGFTIFSLPLSVNVITPNVATGGGTVYISDLSGRGFLPGATVKLSRTGQADIIASSVTVVSQDRITCSFDLSGAATGYWDVKVSTGGAGSFSATMSRGMRIDGIVLPGLLVDNTANTMLTAHLSQREVNVYIPRGTFGENVTLAVSTASVPSSVDPAIRVTNVGVEITNDRGLQPGRAITITLYYTDAEVAGLDEAKLTMARYDGTEGRWIPIPTVVYPDENRIVATIRHLSTFAVVQLAPPTDLSGVKVYPNPFVPLRDTLGLTIAGLTAEANLKIFDISGELVAQPPYDRSGLAHWNGKNDNGSAVASGVYVLLIDSPQGKKMMKIAVQK